MEYFAYDSFALAYLTAENTLNLGLIELCSSSSEAPSEESQKHSLEAS